jgi:error-prone DNA polymerase
MIKGFSKLSAERLVSARATAAFSDVEGLARGARLDRGDLERLAQAGALRDFAQDRHVAHWLVSGYERLPALIADARGKETLPELPLATEGEELIADYATTGLTLGRHPLALLRPRLKRLGMRTATETSTMRNGQHTRAAGIVVCRQRPSTAKGVVFVTLEDETGPMNVIVWPDVVERQRRELLGSRLLGVHGVLQKQGEVVHLVARRLVDHTQLLGALTTDSRDFH